MDDNPNKWIAKEEKERAQKNREAYQERVRQKAEKAAEEKRKAEEKTKVKQEVAADKARRDAAKRSGRLS